jgi:cephalosporin-C deacetylase-like acetyl esterase
VKRLILAVLAAISLLFSLLPAASASAQAPAPGSTTPWNDLRHQFDYPRSRIQITELNATARAGAVVHDITYQARGQQPVSAYLVTPTTRGHHPAAMFLHWLDTPADSNRGEFLDEAVALAAGPRHVISLLPQLTFPFAVSPTGDLRDRQSIIDQVIQLRRGLDLLDARHDVTRTRVAVIGHDYGAMYGTLIAAVDRDRVHANVIMAADASWANWFVEFFLDLPADEVGPYTATLASLDPDIFIRHAPNRVLLQYATQDFFIPLTVAYAMHHAAPPNAVFRTYVADHSLDVPTARTDRDTFLTDALR